MKIHSTTAIEEAARQFKAWRQSKTYKFEPTPNHLKELLKQLLPLYSQKDIVAHLNVSPAIISSLKKARKDSISPQLNTNPEHLINFIPFHLNSPTPIHDSNHTPESAIPSQSCSICHIIKPNGSHLIIQTSDIKTIIQSFLCSN
jgi:hypothetical protein